MRSLVSELKRRNVFKVAVVYVVVGWALIQFADTVFPHLNLPAWSGVLVIVFVFLGFPIAVILAWAFELTPEGVKREGGRRAAVPPEPNSELAAVAVLPFKNLAGPGNDNLLAEAIPLELHNSLSRVHQLRVVSAQSSLAHSRADKDLKSIAAELGVAYVISGSISRFEDRVRVIAELYDATADRLLWSRRFEMQLGDVFETEREIAESVAMAFGGERLRLEMEQVRAGGTKKPGAWQLVQKARGYLLNYSADAVAAAVPLLERAVKLDPNYAVGHAQLGLIMAEKTLNGLSQDAAAERAAAVRAIDRAERLAPSDPVVLRSAGAVHAYCGNNQRSIELLRRAVALAPYDLGSWGYLGWPLVATGKSKHLAEAHSILDRLLERGPKHPGHPYWLFHKSVACCVEDRAAEALELAERATAEQPRFALAWMHRANLHGRLAERAEAAEAARRAAAVNPKITPAYYVELMGVLSSEPAVVESRTAGLAAAGLGGPGAVGSGLQAVTSGSR